MTAWQPANIVFYDQMLIESLTVCHACGWPCFVPRSIPEFTQFRDREALLELVVCLCCTSDKDIVISQMRKLKLTEIKINSSSFRKAESFVCGQRQFPAVPGTWQPSNNRWWGDSEYMRPRVDGTPVPPPDSSRLTQSSVAITQHPSVKGKSSFRVQMKGCSCRRKTK